MQITISKSNAKSVRKSIVFMLGACSNKTAKNPNATGLSDENMKVLEMTPKALLGLVKVIQRIDKTLIIKK